MPPGKPWTPELFLEKVSIDPTADACWEWQGCRDANGYGDTWFRGKRERAHRVSWMLFRGDDIAGKDICHRCDNPSCVRPEHLFVGTAKDNVADMMTKGRHTSSKLTWGDVRNIRALYRRGRVRQVDLATQFGVRQTMISRIVTRQCWK